jgi:MFS family permease
VSAASPAPVTPTPRSARARFASGFQALGNRNYRLYWLGQLVSMTGSWMQTTAQAWLVLELTKSPLAIGLVATLQFLPVMLLSLPGGVIADRVPRYQLILVTQLLAGVLAAIFGGLVLSGTITLWQIYGLALAMGVVNAIDQPVRQAFAVQLVSAAERSNAIALNSVLFNTARIIGPALAGVLIGPAGVGAVLLCNALSYLAAIGALLLMDGHKRAQSPQQTQTAGEGLRAGLRYIRGTPEVLLVLGLVAVIGTFGYNFSVTLPLIGGFILNTSPEAYGVLGAALGVGSLVAALRAAYVRTITLRRLVLAATAFGLLLGAVALTQQFVVAALVLLALGFAGVSFTTAASTLIQLRVPDALRGRVTSVYLLLFVGSTPLGGLLVGSAAQAFGVPAALLLCATLCLLGVGCAMVAVARR